jgi:uncharacterized protein YjbJ (UPF0337 family)
MSGMQDNEEQEQKEAGGLRDKVSGTTQAIIGEIERVGGILTADPNTEAEGEFNVEVGEVREEIEAELNAPDEDNLTPR